MIGSFILYSILKQNPNTIRNMDIFSKEITTIGSNLDIYVTNIYPNHEHNVLEI